MQIEEPLFWFHFREVSSDLYKNFPKNFLRKFFLGGALIVGEQTLTYHGSGQYVKTVRIKTAIIKAVGKLDMSR